MEKDHKPKEQIYVSKKVLGQLYDQVERVDFVPVFDYSFDKRILNAYELDAKTIEAAADLKKQYDTAMRRIMAQHDINTEFEVWTTFVLHHANQSSDYKFHEEMGEISGALKDRFRTACYEKAGSKDFEVMGPFVAAMYRVTQEEMAQALEECNQTKMVGGQERKVRRMVTKNMPLMSFPWLFHGILGKIANGELRQRTGVMVDTTAVIQGELKKTTPKLNRVGVGIMDAEDTLLTAEGVIHRGEALELFHHGEEAPGNPQEDQSIALDLLDDLGTAISSEAVEALGALQEDQTIALDLLDGLGTATSSKAVEAPGGPQEDQSIALDLLDDLGTATSSKAVEAVQDEYRVLEDSAVHDRQAIPKNPDGLTVSAANDVGHAENDILIDFGMDEQETTSPLPTLQRTPSLVSQLLNLDMHEEQLIDVPRSTKATPTVSTASNVCPSVDDMLLGDNDMDLSSTSADLYPMSICSDNAAMDTPQEDEPVLTPSTHSNQASPVEIVSSPSLSPARLDHSANGSVPSRSGSRADELVHVYPDDTRSMEHLAQQTANLDFLEGTENLDEWISRHGDVSDEEVVKDGSGDGSEFREGDVEVHIEIRPSPLERLAEMVGDLEDDGD